MSWGCALCRMLNPWTPPVWHWWQPLLSAVPRAQPGRAPSIACTYLTSPEALEPWTGAHLVFALQELLSQPLAWPGGDLALAVNWCSLGGLLRGLLGQPHPQVPGAILSFPSTCSAEAAGRGHGSSQGAQHVLHLHSGPPAPLPPWLWPGDTSLTSVPCWELLQELLLRRKREMLLLASRRGML